MTVTVDEVKTFRAGFEDGANRLEDSAGTLTVAQDGIDNILSGYDALVLSCHQISAQIDAEIARLADQGVVSEALANISTGLALIPEAKQEDRDRIATCLKDVATNTEQSLRIMFTACGEFEEAATRAEPAAPSVPTNPTPASTRVPPSLERHAGMVTS